MRVNAQLDRLPLFDESPHAKILGVFFLVFGVAHGIVLGFALVLFLFLLLTPLRNPSENEVNLEFAIILSIVVPFIAMLPIIAGYGLLSRRPWARSLIGFSVVMTLLHVALVTFILVLKAEQYPLLLYVGPCLILIMYAAWFVWRRKPAG